MIHWTDRYIGFPWLAGGRDVIKGLDCWGLLRYVYEWEFGIELSPHACSTQTLADHLRVQDQELANANWRETVMPREGDAVALGKGALFDHVGIFTDIGEPAILHARSGVLSELITLKEMTRLGWKHVKFYRHVNMYSSH
jgi:cell wall-associated NlpC family hydrolase